MPLYDALPGQPRPHAMAEYRAGLCALCRALAGSWVSHTDGRVVAITTPANGELALDGELYLPHPFWPGLFRASIAGSSLMPHADLLWLRDDGAHWRAHCRPGLAELREPPTAPDTSLALDVAQDYLSLAAGVWRADVHDDHVIVALERNRRVAFAIAAGRIDIAEPRDM
jgi:hypothetical protein